MALEEESKVELKLKRCKLVADFVPTAMRMEDLWLSGVEYQNEEEEEEEEENGVKENNDSDSDDSIFWILYHILLAAGHQLLLSISISKYLYI